MHEYFRGNPNGRSPLEFLREREPIPAAYRERDARVAALDRQGLESIWLFPTLGVLYEELLKRDTEAVALTFRAFNQWLEEDWGVNYKERIFAAPYIPMCSPEVAIRELDWSLARGARVVCMRPAPAWTSTGPVSPGDAIFDPFWARVNEAGVAVVVHAADSGYSSNGYARDGFGASFDGGGWKPSIKSFNIERAAHDFLITLVFDKLFDRFPNLRIASVENGSDYLADLFTKLRQTQKKTPGYFKEDPVETFRRHVWINPFWEDDLESVVEWMGADRVVFGSDWPHIEGLPEPRDYLRETKNLDPADRRLVLHDNAVALGTLQPR
jgi:predicted TIM-barrel fold metal-dependent hydrolase